MTAKPSPKIKTSAFSVTASTISFLGKRRSKQMNFSSFRNSFNVMFIYDYRKKSFTSNGGGGNILANENTRKWAISELSFASVSKRVFVRNDSYGNEFSPKVHFHANQTHYHLKGFAPGLVLKQRQKKTQKWPINIFPQY